MTLRTRSRSIDDFADAVSADAHLDVHIAHGVHFALPLIFCDAVAFHTRLHFARAEPIFHEPCLLMVPVQLERARSAWHVLHKVEGRSLLVLDLLAVFVQYIHILENRLHLRLFFGNIRHVLGLRFEDVLQDVVLAQNHVRPVEDPRRAVEHLVRVLGVAIGIAGDEVKPDLAVPRLIHAFGGHGHRATERVARKVARVQLDARARLVRKKAIVHMRVALNDVVEDGGVPLAARRLKAVGLLVVKHDPVQIEHFQHIQLFARIGVPQELTLP